MPRWLRDGGRQGFQRRTKLERLFSGIFRPATDLTSVSQAEGEIGLTQLSTPGAHMGYCLIREGGGGEHVIVLAGRDRELSFADVVLCMGGDIEWVSGQVVRDLSKFGFRGDAVFRMKQEPALSELFVKIAC